MSDNDAPTTKLSPNFICLYDVADTVLDAYDFRRFNDLITEGKFADATKLLEGVQVTLSKLDSPDLAEIRHKQSDQAYYAAFDKQVDDLRSVTQLIDDWKSFLASDSAFAVLADFIDEKNPDSGQ